nr:immunoglobulin heavy chain junction region [Mus musculus]MBK4185569.1 immunoglobulin heavy chain junction region [Mus musculus]MBK4185571.1 immunoglobulin heavy chain junction region [Mus musculus]
CARGIPYYAMDYW